MPAYIGTSGWIYRDWKERFYPKGLRQADWLSYLSRRFNTAEINYTFYRFPRPKAVEEWSNAVPSRFRFAVKLWRGMTQYRKLRNCRAWLENFFEALDPLPQRQRGPLLVQLPPAQGRDIEKLDAFLGEVREVTGRARWKIAVEFRRENWLCDETYRLLDRHRAALCLHDMPNRAPVAEPNDASFIYLRRHGATGKYEGRYEEHHLKADATRIRHWLKQGRTVYAYYNNDRHAHAPANAARLKDLVESGS
ncbi:MAG: DUF72 domain-containing protein [Planctomycetes bacterium]|nr:DUF72 domain-containing protein [Planctomycetota bacterium]